MNTGNRDSQSTVANGNMIQWHRWLTYAALGIISYFLIVEHREHILPFLPYLFLLACPLMHIFMHRGHGHGHSHHEGKDLQS